jgi:peptide/nickel transport system permease protein
MLSYILRRLLLLPITLLFIVLINFVIINLAPGDPTTITEISPDGGASRREEKAFAFGSDDKYLQFREYYGLTLPILWNSWPWTSRENLLLEIHMLIEKKLSVKEYDQLRIKFGDRAKYVMDHLVSIADDSTLSWEVRQMAQRFIVRGGTRQAVLGYKLSKADREYNKRVAGDNLILSKLRFSMTDPEEVRLKRISDAKAWVEGNNDLFHESSSTAQKLSLFLFDTRFCRYLGRVLTFDFGTLRNDENKRVIDEVVKRFKYSLTLAVMPMLITFVLCQIFGFYMAVKQGGWQDNGLNVVFLILYATPVFVVAPFLIEKMALNQTFPFTNIPIPISGFTSEEAVYSKLTSWERLWDVVQHIALPLVAIVYGSLAVQSRLSRTAVLEVLRHDYVRTARAKGLSSWAVLYKHVGRNAAITIVTSIAGSLGVILGGSLIVETIFGINGFGLFFYEAIVNRDYNVIMFSALSGAFLSLVGYLVADIAYMMLDPRVTLE